MAALGPAGAGGPLDLVAHARLDLGVLGQEHERPHGGVGHGVVAGVQHGDDLVAQLAIVHALAGLRILGADQQADEIGPGIGRRLPLPDDAIDELVDRVQRSREALAARRRHPRGQPHGQEQASELDLVVDAVDRLRSAPACRPARPRRTACAAWRAASAPSAPRAAAPVRARAPSAPSRRSCRRRTQECDRRRPAVASSGTRPVRCAAAAARRRLRS